MAGRFDDSLDLRNRKDGLGKNGPEPGGGAASPGDAYENSLASRNKHPGVFNPLGKYQLLDWLDSLKQMHFLPAGVLQEIKRQFYTGLSLCLFMFAVFSVFAFLSYDPLDSSFNTASDRTYTYNWMGIIGAYFADFCLQAFGYVAWLLPVVILGWVFFVCRGGNTRLWGWRLAFLPWVCLSFGGIMVFAGIETTWTKPISAGGAGGEIFLFNAFRFLPLPHWLIVLLFLVAGLSGLCFVAAIPREILRLIPDFLFKVGCFSRDFVNSLLKNKPKVRMQPFDLILREQEMRKEETSAGTEEVQGFGGFSFETNQFETNQFATNQGAGNPGSQAVDHGADDETTEEGQDETPYGPIISLDLKIEERWTDLYQNTAKSPAPKLPGANDGDKWQYSGQPLDISYTDVRGRTTTDSDSKDVLEEDMQPDEQGKTRVQPYGTCEVFGETGTGKHEIDFDLEKSDPDRLQVASANEEIQNEGLEKLSQDPTDTMETIAGEGETIAGEGETMAGEGETMAREVDFQSDAEDQMDDTDDHAENQVEDPYSSDLIRMQSVSTTEEQVKSAVEPMVSLRYRKPSLEFLAKPGTTDVANRQTREELEKNAELLTSVLSDFGVKGKITNVRPGPVVTLFELKPAPGTKTSRVVNLADDIARSMSAFSARIATVPGRNVIGIEIPNPVREMVLFRELLEAPAYSRLSARLPIALGKDIGGSPVYVDLAKMPHLLIAGTTGSGKSVAVNTMILSMLYSQSPEHCKFIMIDPKMLELSVYDGIPHLLSPVVTDPKKAIVALNWAVREMEERYQLMSNVGVRNIEGFNKRIETARRNGEILQRKVQTGFDVDTGAPVYEDQEIALTTLPFIVIIIDEMADLMLVAGKDIEAALQRLAQMARAAGIHMVTATQRPSVDVITGTIKANFPTRISFHVTSKIDSRTILGEMGAEQLLGQGDMLYMPNGGRIQRVHGPFASDGEVEKVVSCLREMGEPEYVDAILSETEEAPTGSSAFKPSGDELYDQAVAIVLREKKASISFVQRHLQIGYNRAARLIEQMEAENLITSQDRVGRRTILAGNGDENVV